MVARKIIDSIESKFRWVIYVMNLSRRANKPIDKYEEFLSEDISYYETPIKKEVEKNLLKNNKNYLKLVALILDRIEINITKNPDYQNAIAKFFKNYYQIEKLISIAKKSTNRQHKIDAMVYIFMQNLVLVEEFYLNANPNFTKIKRNFLYDRVKLLGLGSYNKKIYLLDKDFPTDPKLKLTNHQLKSLYGLLMQDHIDTSEENFMNVFCKDISNLAQPIVWKDISEKKLTRFFTASILLFVLSYQGLTYEDYTNVKVNITMTIKTFVKPNNERIIRKSMTNKQKIIINKNSLFHTEFDKLINAVK